MSFKKPTIVSRYVILHNDFKFHLIYVGMAERSKAPDSIQPRAPIWGVGDQRPRKFRWGSCEYENGGYLGS